MDDESVSSKAAATLALAHSALDDLFAADLALDTSDDVLNVGRELNRLRNRLAGLEHGVIADVQRRGLPFELGARNTAALLRDLLRISGAEASARVRAADAAASRTSLLGEALPAPFPVVAAAQATGAISPAHARVVVQTVEELPDAVQVAEGAAIEAQLVDLAHRFDPTQVATLAHRIAMHHDPDGVLKDCEYRDKHRDLRLTRRADGSGDLAGAVTAELGERLEVVFDALAGPRAEVDGVKDARTAGQRRHDALLEVLEMATRRIAPLRSRSVRHDRHPRHRRELGDRCRHRDHQSRCRHRHQ